MQQAVVNFVNLHLLYNQLSAAKLVNRQIVRSHHTINRISLHSNHGLSEIVELTYQANHVQTDLNLLLW